MLVMMLIGSIMLHEKTRMTPYHPHNDGLVERFNRTLLDMLSTCVKDHPFQCVL